MRPFLSFLLLSCSLSLRASRECQNKERLLEQRFRAALRDFQQWLVNAKISTAKCFDVPQTVTEASSALQRIQVRDIFCKTLIYSFFLCVCVCVLRGHITVVKLKFIIFFALEFFQDRLT